MNISIIIPTFREEENIGKLVRYLKELGKETVVEIIVSDGGSDDTTIKTAEDAGAKTVISQLKGRAAQMHQGALIAKGEILYFVHADSFPPDSFPSDIIDAVKNGYPIGRYQTKFNSAKWYLKINAWFTRFDWFVCLGGDQTLFITRDLYQQMGGFNTDMLIMEEFEFVKRARKNVQYKIFKKPALVSARKYDTNSWWRVQIANKKMVSMYKKGNSQQEMIETYKAMLDYR